LIPFGISLRRTIVFGSDGSGFFRRWTLALRAKGCGGRRSAAWPLVDRSPAAEVIRTQKKWPMRAADVGGPAPRRCRIPQFERSGRALRRSCSSFAAVTSSSSHEVHPCRGIVRAYRSDLPQKVTAVFVDHKSDGLFCGRHKVTSLLSNCATGRGWAPILPMSRLDDRPEANTKPQGTGPSCPRSAGRFSDPSPLADVISEKPFDDRHMRPGTVDRTQVRET